MTPPPTVLVAGNPNSGKSTLFNALTGSRAHVANYPGVTIDRVSAPLTVGDDHHIELVDLPGTYSLSARSREEQIAVDALLGRSLPSPEAVVVVVDAATLGRALFLAVEIIATGVPVVLALNMSDEAARDGLSIDVARLAAMTGTRSRAHRGHARRRHRRTQGRDRPRAPPRRRPTRCSSNGPRRSRWTSPSSKPRFSRERALTRAGAARAWATWLLLSLDDEGADDLVGDSRRRCGR